MPTNRIASSVAAIVATALLAGCGGGSTATQSAGVSSSSLTTTTSLTPSVSASSTSTSTSTTTTASPATTSISRTTRSTHAQSVKPATAGGTAPGGSASTAKTPPGKFAIASAAFPRGGQIPARYTCDGGNVSPPLQWGKLPAGTSQLFVLALSLTAGASGAIRWAVGGIDPGSGGFAAGQLPSGAVVGRSSDGHVGWSGVCGARGKAQAVIVLVYALRHPLHLTSGFDPRAVQSKLAGNTVGSGVVYGAYRRP
jgi:phosphatidylethanolamine-binding protein (PEBP) family uncharacterized protein